MGSAAPSNIHTSRPFSRRSIRGRPLGGLAAQAPLEEMGWLDHVVVDAHQDQIVDLHVVPLLRCDAHVTELLD